MSLKDFTLQDSVAITRFVRVTLRTSEIAGARAFYATLLGRDELDIAPLPEAAARRGAPSHWLGELGVNDVEKTACDFTARGAARIGPTRATADGGEMAIVRDPGGAVVALTTRPKLPVQGGFVWYHLNTANIQQAMSNYGDLFGWKVRMCSDPDVLGEYHEFAWRAGEPYVGSMSDIAGRAGVHPLPGDNYPGRPAKIIVVGHWPLGVEP
jgi:predicted enzyme related to lactoylglutathione lyase